MTEVSLEGLAGVDETKNKIEMRVGKCDVTDIMYRFDL